MGDSYRDRENSYTPALHHELNGVDFGPGPPARGGLCVRWRVRACVGSRARQVGLSFLVWHSTDCVQFEHHRPRENLVIVVDQLSAGVDFDAHSIASFPIHI